MEAQTREKETTVRIVKWKKRVLCMAGHCCKHSRTINIHPRNPRSHLPPWTAVFPQSFKYIIYRDTGYELLECDTVKFLFV